MITGSVAPALPSFLPFYSRLRTFLIQWAGLSRSLEHARSLGTVYPIIIYGDILLAHFFALFLYLPTLTR